MHAARLAIVFLAVLWGCRDADSAPAVPEDAALAVYPVWGSQQSIPTQGRNLNALWIAGDGSRGWAPGDDGLLMRFDGHAWTEHYLPDVPRTHWREIAFDASGTVGFIVGSEGRILRYVASRGSWALEPSVGTGSDFVAVWVDPSGARGYALTVDGGVFAWAGGRWAALRLSRPFVGRAAQITVQGQTVWIRDIGARVSFYRHVGKELRWDHQLPQFKAYHLWSQEGRVWLAGVDAPAPRAPDDSVGYIVRWDDGSGASGRITQLPLIVIEAGWVSRDRRRGLLVGYDEDADGRRSYRSVVLLGDTAMAGEVPGAARVTGIWMDSSGTKGWAAGHGGLSSVTWRRVDSVVVHSRAGSAGDGQPRYSFRLERGAGVPPPRLVDLSIVRGKKKPVALVEGEDYTVQTWPDSIVVRGEEGGAGIHGGRLRFGLVFPLSPEGAHVVRYQVGLGRAPIPTWLVIVAGVLAVPLLLVLSLRVGALQYILYSQHVRAVFGAWLAWADPVAMKWGWFRRALLQNYRRRLPREHLGLRDLPHREPVGYAIEVSAPAGEGPAGAAVSEAAMETILDRAVAHPRSLILWLEVSEGVDVSDLLGRATLHLLGRAGLTPFLIHHDPDFDVTGQVRADWKRYGGFPREGPPLYEAPGFAFVLDARATGGARLGAFLNEVAENLVIVAAHVPPSLPGREVWHVRVLGPRSFVPPTGDPVSASAEDGPATEPLQARPYASHADRQSPPPVPADVVEAASTHPPQSPPMTRTAIFVTALPLEFLAVREHLSAVERRHHPDGTVFDVGIFETPFARWEVAIVESGPGNPSAVLHTERAVQLFKPSHAFFVGVAGGIKDVRVGDVVAATKVYAYESGKVEGDRFLARPEVFSSSYALQQEARAAAREGGWVRRIISGVEDAGFPTPAALVGPIAAGEKVVASDRAELYRFLRQSYGDAVAVEMEGFGFLRALHANARVEALVVRGTSDLLAGKAEADRGGSQPVAARRAAAFAFEVLANLVQPAAASRHEPRSEDSWTRVGALAPRLYELGPTERDLWTRAGGEVSRLRIQGRGRDDWFAALRELRNGGGGGRISMRSLLVAMAEDFPNHGELRELRDSFMED